MALQLGDTAPDFTAETTVGTTRGAATTLDDNICTAHVHKPMENVS